MPDDAAERSAHSRTYGPNPNFSQSDCSFFSPLRLLTNENLSLLVVSGYQDYWTAGFEINSAQPRACGYAPKMQILVTMTKALPSIKSGLLNIKSKL